MSVLVCVRRGRCGCSVCAVRCSYFLYSMCAVQWLALSSAFSTAYEDSAGSTSSASPSLTCRALLVSGSGGGGEGEDNGEEERTDDSSGAD